MNLRKSAVLVLLGLALCGGVVGYAAESEKRETDSDLVLTENAGSEWAAPKPSLESNEITVFGSVGQGSIIDRLDRLDQALVGTVQSGTVNTRVQKQAERLRGGEPGRVSILTRINAAEWSLDREVSMKPLEERLVDLESRLTGRVSSYSLETRSKTVASHVVENPDGILVDIPTGTLVRIEFVDPLTSKTAKVGDVARIRVAEDVFVEGRLVFPKGAMGQASVESVRPARRLARNGRLALTFDYVETIDGQPVHFIQGAKSLDATETYAKAAGVSVAGLVILGPIGLIGGAFLNGENAVVKEGSMLYIETDQEYQAITVDLQ